MGYYMRYISIDPRPLELGELGRVLAKQDSAYQLTLNENEGILHYADSGIGRLELNLPGDGIFDEELADLRESPRMPMGPHNRPCRRCSPRRLRRCATMIASTRGIPGRAADERLRP